MNASPFQIKGHIAGIEAGGTKFICATLKDSDDILNRIRIPTQTPQATFAQVVEYLQAQEAEFGLLEGIGVASFGPLNVNPDSSQYGLMGQTPKPGWGGTDMLQPLREHFDVPVAIDTDVNCAALGEGIWGAARGLTSHLYITIGTGIGGGAVSKGALVGGLSHPEMGHIILPRDQARDTFAGVCPYHQNCFEGLASGPAIEARWGASAESLPPEHEAWKLEAHYIALAVINYAMILMPQRVVLGGGVMRQTQLWPLIRKEVSTYMKDYLPFKEMGRDIDQWLVPPEREGDSGLLGAVALVIGRMRSTNH